LLALNRATELDGTELVIPIVFTKHLFVVIKPAGRENTVHVMVLDAQAGGLLPGLVLVRDAIIDSLE
jgi:hypothetical protein